MFNNPATKDILASLYAINIDQLRRPELTGVGFDFQDVADKISDIANVYKKIDDSQEKITLTTEEENNIQSNINGLISNVINPVISFSVKDNSNASQQYQDIINNLNNLHNAFIALTRPLTTVIDISNLTPGQLKSEINAFSDFRNSAEKILKELNEKKESAETIIRKASGIGATSSSGDIFSTQAKEHQDLAKNWFRASIASFAVLFLAFIFIFNSWPPFENFNIAQIKDNVTLIHALVFKLLILSSIYFILHQCVKSYKINKHLYVINKHKHNALSVYPQILTAGEDPETRSAIASQAAKSIFEQVPTGYLDYDDDPRPVNPTAIVNKIIERKA